VLVKGLALPLRGQAGRTNYTKVTHSSRQRHTADKSGGDGNEGVRFPVAGRSTQPVAFGVGRCNAGALS
jgi:hypothetical protein